MNKAFVKEGDGADEDEMLAPALRLPPGSRNYMTRRGYDALREELETLVRVDRPRLVETVAWAAGNGDRSENGDYIYGKKRLREIDRRIRFLIKRIENAEVVDPGRQENVDRVFFGATVTICDVDGDEEQTWQIVGVDEADASAGRISWIAPLSRALLKAREGDTVRFQSPAGLREIEVVEIRYV
jgi:transcription elongation factor GreB